MIPAIVEQYITKLLDITVPRQERDNCRFVLVTIRDTVDRAIRKYDGKRA